MTSRVATLAARSPRALLAACLIAGAALSAYAVGVPERLALGGGSLAGSESARAAEALAAGLGHEPEPAFVLVLSGAEPIDAATGAVAVEAVRGQAEAIAGVAAVRERGTSADGLTTSLAVHLRRGAGGETAAVVAERLGTDLDPGPLELIVGGAEPTAEQARDVVLDDAVPFVLLVLPLLVLVLAAALGLRLGLATLLGALLAVGGSVALLGVLGEVFEIRAIASVAAAVVALVVAVEAAASLLYRYHEESAGLGGGAEALDYSMRSVLRGAGIGIFSAALVGVALYAIPISLVQSVGAGIVVAALVAPALALPPLTAALSLRSEEEVGEALPLVSERGSADDAPLGFRLLLGIARRRRRAALVVAPIAVVILAALPLLGANAIGLDAAELPADRAAARADAELAGAFGPGAGGPLLVAAEGEPQSPGVTVYRDQVARLPGVDSVALAAPAGELAAFEVTPTARPRSLGAQRTAAAVVGAPAAGGGGVTGPAAELRDAARRLGGDLPLVLLVALLGTAALWSLLFRSAFGPLLALSAAAAPLVGLGAMVVVFGDGRLDGLLDYRPAGAPHLSSYVVVGSVLLAIALSRGAQTAAALREERLLGGGAAGSLARSGLLTLMPAAVSTSVAGIAVLVWLASPLTAAKEIAVGLAIGLLADLFLTRALIAPGLARLSLGRVG